MKTSIKTIISVIALGASAIFVQAQPALKVATVDLGKALAGFYKTQEEQAKLQAYEQDANRNYERLLNEGRQMATQLQAQVEAVKNPVLNDIAKRAAEADAQRLYQEMQKKEQELNEYRQQAVRFIQQGAASTRQMLLVEISKVAEDIAKKKGVNMLIERNAFVYGDAAFDISDEVLAELNKNAPPPAPAASGAVPSVGLPR